MMGESVGQWETIRKALERRADRPQWIQGEDQYRVMAYDLYEAIYWTAPQSFQVTMRGQEGDPVYVPSGRQVVNTAHRFMAPKMQVIADPEFGEESQQQLANTYFTEFARRERFYSKFSAAKRKGLTRGDWIFHIMADPDKEQDSRVSIFAIDPSNYFPVFDEGDPTSIRRVILAEPDMLRDETVVHRLIYTKEGGRVSVREDLCQVDEWAQPGTDMDETILQVLEEETFLPEPIDQIPVYHIPNGFDDEYFWGSSEMRGIEHLIGGINQAITDQQLALVLDGIGVYVTDAGAPVDDDGNELPWTVAVGHVLELPAEKNFSRVQGVSSVQPYLDHLAYLHQQIDATTGGNDITSGRADVQVAESGIALALRMGPILAAMEEKELVVTEACAQMFFGLNKWFVAFERLEGMLDIRFVPVYGEKLPVNPDKVFDQVMKMYSATPKPIISAKEARRRLAAIGYAFSDDDTLDQEIIDEQTAFAGATADAIASRVNGELNA